MQPPPPKRERTSNEKPGGGVFSRKISYKFLIQNRLTIGYQVHFARFCATFYGQLSIARLFTPILRRFEVILARRLQKQPIRETNLEGKR